MEPCVPDVAEGVGAEEVAEAVAELPPPDREDMLSPSPSPAAELSVPSRTALSPRVRLDGQQGVPTCRATKSHPTPRPTARPAPRSRSTAPRIHQSLFLLLDGPFPAAQRGDFSLMAAAPTPAPAAPAAPAAPTGAMWPTPSSEDVLDADLS